MSEKLFPRSRLEIKRGHLERGVSNTRAMLLILFLTAGVVGGGLYLRNLDNKKDSLLGLGSLGEITQGIAMFVKSLQPLLEDLGELENMLPPLSRPGTWVSDKGGSVTVVSEGDSQDNPQMDCGADEEAMDIKLVAEGEAQIPPGEHVGRFCVSPDVLTRTKAAVEDNFTPAEGVDATLLLQDSSGVIRRFRARTGAICDSTGVACTQWKYDQPLPEPDAGEDELDLESE